MKTNNSTETRGKREKQQKQIFITPSRDLFRFSLHFIKRLISLSLLFFIQSISHTTRQSSKSISYILALTFHFFLLFFLLLIIWAALCGFVFCSTLANAAWKHIYLLRQESWAEYYCVDKTWTHNSEFIMQINRAVRLLRISHLLCCLCFFASWTFQFSCMLDRRSPFSAI